MIHRLVRNTIAFIVATVFLTASVSAQNASKDTVFGSLQSSSPQLDSGEHYQAHTWDGEAGEVVFVYLHSADFDPYLVVLDPDSQAIVDVDNAAPFGRDAFVVGPLQSAGTHTLVVTSAKPKETGKYKLTVQTGVTPLGTYKGDLSKEGIAFDAGRVSNVYILEGRAGKRVSVKVDGARFTPDLFVIAPDGTHAANQPKSNTLAYTYPADGYYLLLVSTLRNPGPYQVSISEGATDRVGGGVSPPSSHTTGRADPHPAVRQS